MSETSQPAVFVAISQGSETTITLGVYTARNNALAAILEDVLQTLDRTTTPDEFDELNATGHLLADDFEWHLQAVELNTDEPYFS